MGMPGFDRDRRYSSHAEAGSAPRKYPEPNNKCQLIFKSQNIHCSSFQPGNEFCLCRGLIAASVALAIPGN